MISNRPIPTQPVFASIIQTAAFGCLALALCVFASASNVRADELEEAQRFLEEFSPLHELLGIDPKTGQFKAPRPQTNPRGSAPAETPQPENDDADSAWDNRPTEPFSSGSAQDLSDAARVLENLLNRAQRHPGGGSGELDGLDDLTSLLGGKPLSEQLLEWNSFFAWTTAALLMFYPFGVVSSELLSLLWRGKGEKYLTDSDRRYLRTRFRRRIALATAMTGFIVLATLGTVNVAWWSDPTKLAALATGCGVLGLAVATLSSLVKQAAGERVLELVREVRQQQKDLQQELDGLRRNMPLAGFPGG